MQTRALMLLCSLVMTGCSYNVVGTWRIQAMTIGQEQIDDAGILDIQQDGAESSAAPVWFLLRYYFDADEGAFKPDPDPLAEMVTFNFQTYSEDEPTDLVLPIPGDRIARTVYEASFRMERPDGGVMTLKDPDFSLGPLEWELTR